MKQLTIGVESAKFYPLYSTTPKNEYVGFARDLFDNFGKAKGYDITYKPYRINNIFGKYYEGDCDIKFPDNPFWDADNKTGKDIRYSSGVVEFIDGTMIEPENKGKGLKRIKTLGAIRGFTPFDYLDLIKNGDIVLNERTALQGLITGMLSEQFDAFYINVAIARYMMASMDQEDIFVFDPELPHTRAEYFASSIHRPEVIADLNDYLRESAADIQALRKKYKVSLDGL